MAGAATITATGKAACTVWKSLPPDSRSALPVAVLSAMSRAPLAAPSPTRARPSASGVVTSPMPAAASANSAVLTASAIRSLPLTSRPVSAIAGMAPTGTPASARPRSALVAPTWVCTAGSSADHDPQKTPQTAQTATSLASVMRA
ncbi:hypothetical protein [Nonomuraea roseola]|uniref:hypothetical protein n=1 Tax=Nonomuraea roseola TaxID=46179 RepID=UPI0031F9B7C7